MLILNLGKCTNNYYAINIIMKHNENTTSSVNYFMYHITLHVFHFNFLKILKRFLLKEVIMRNIFDGRFYFDSPSSLL